jgi:hypothetical protein
MEVARRTFGRWKPEHKDLKAQIVIERRGVVLMRFDTDLSELEEVEQMARDLLREVAAWREDYAKAWREKDVETKPTQDNETSE